MCGVEKKVYAHATLSFICDRALSSSSSFSVDVEESVDGFLFTLRRSSWREWKRRQKEKKKNVLHGALSYSQNTHFGDIFKCRPSMTYTHFSISIIGGCRVRGGNEWRLSTGRSFGWLCWNGFWSGSGLIIGGTLISTLDEEPSRVATQRNFWSDWAFNSLRDGSAKLIHKAEFWFLNYPPKRGDLVFLLLLWIFFFFFAI